MHLDSDIKKLVEDVIMIASHLPELMNKATPEQKRELLNLILTDCTINGQRLNYHFKKPFDKFLTSAKPSEWKSVSIDNMQEANSVKYSIEKISDRLA